MGCIMCNKNIYIISAGTKVPHREAWETNTTDELSAYNINCRVVYGDSAGLLSTQPIQGIASTYCMAELEP